MFPPEGICSLSAQKKSNPPAEQGNLIYAVGALAAPPHCLPLVEPLRPGPGEAGAFR